MFARTLIHTRVLSFLSTFLLAQRVLCAMAGAHAAELNLEALSSLNGSGKVGVRVAGEVQLWGPLRLGVGVAALPGAVITDLTPAFRIGDDSKLWAQFSAGPAYSSSPIIDTNTVGTRFMFHDEAMVGYGPVHLGFTHYSNAYIRAPNMGSNFLTFGIKIPLH